MQSEKSYHLFDYSGLSSEEGTRLSAAQKNIEWWCTKEQDFFHPSHHPDFLRTWVNEDPQFTINEHMEPSLQGLYRPLGSVPDAFGSSDFCAYIIAAHGMEIAMCLDKMFPSQIAQITDAQLQIAHRSNKEEVYRMMALCRNNPEGKEQYIEECKTQLRIKLAKKLLLNSSVDKKIPW